MKVGFKFHPHGYKPEIQSTLISIGTADLDMQLRAKRLGTGSRTYTLTYVLTSGSGTGVMAWAKVVVPHDQRIESHATAKKPTGVRRRSR